MLIGPLTQGHVLSYLLGPFAVGVPQKKVVQAEDDGDHADGEDVPDDGDHPADLLVGLGLVQLVHDGGGGRVGVGGGRGGAHGEGERAHDLGVDHAVGRGQGVAGGARGGVLDLGGRAAVVPQTVHGS